LKADRPKYKINTITYEHPTEYIELENDINNKNNGELIIIKGGYKNQNPNILIDTGSKASLVKESIFENNSDLNNNLIKIP